MPPSRTALALASRGDPIFGAIGRLLARGVRGVVGIAKRAVGKRVKVAVEGAQTALAKIPGAGAVTAVAKSKPARVIAEVAGTGGVAFVAGRAGARRALGPVSVEGEFAFGPSGCPTGKVVQVAAHTRIIPIDRFGNPRRRINVLNVRALGRATRRLGGFQKRARRVEKQLARIAPRSRSRKRKC